MSKNESNSESFLKDIGTLVKNLEAGGFDPVLVGGMALMLFGSERITKDFDFIVSQHQEQIKELVDIFYDLGFELATRLDEKGRIISTLDNRHVAAVRLNLDEPVSVYFLHPTTGLRVDVLFDFPVAAKELMLRAQKMTIKSHTLTVASPQDILRLKEIAFASRGKASDAQDIEFLKELLVRGIVE